MKKIFFVVMIPFLSSNVFAQKSQKMDIPEPVLSSFQKQYSDVPESKWEKEGENFEVEFTHKGKEESVVYDASGKWLEKEEEIKIEELPKASVDYVGKTYKGQKIKEASRITKADGSIFYEAEIKGRELIFDSEGKYVKENKD
jgi:predicted flavoprotein YhiN